MREALIYWRRYEKVEREQRRKAEKEAVGQRKMDDEMREVCVWWGLGVRMEGYNSRDKELYMLDVLIQAKEGPKKNTQKTAWLSETIL